MDSADIKAEAGPPAQLYAPLPKPPTAFSLTVRALLGRIQQGAIRVPKFQRPLRWSGDDVEKLFDSLLKGYPVGSLLFWKRPLPAGEITVGNANLEAPAVVDGWHIVDGQQRTTALAASLLDLDQRGDPRWDLYFDVRTNVVRRGTPGPAEARRLVPLRVLGDLRRLGRWLRECELDEPQQQRVEEVQQRLLDYELPGYLMETDDEAALRGVFARLNSTGVRMRADEVFHALLGVTTPTPGGAARRLDLSQLQKAADLDGFGEPPRGEVLKAVLAMSGLDPTSRLDKLGEDALAQLVGHDEAAEALRGAVSFLQAPPDAALPGPGVPALAFLPYPVAFVILARFFYLFPSPDEAARRALSTWLWRGVTTGVHQRAAVSAMRLQVKEVGGTVGESLSRLLAVVGGPPSAEWSLDPFHASHAASRVEILALLDRAPRDRDGLVSWRALLSSGERVAREIFRVDPLDGELRALARTAANRVLLDTRHSDLRSELRRWSWDEPREREALESHLIDEEGLEDLRSGRIGELLRRRAARLRAHVGAFLGRRAGFGEPLVMPLAAYLDTGTGVDDP